MRQPFCTLCVLLLLAFPAHAAETLDEKIYDPGQQPPTGSPASPDARGVPGQGVPNQTQGDTIIVVPSVPEQSVPSPAVPGQRMPNQNGTAPDTIAPDTRQKEAPTLVVPSLPTLPSAPVTPLPVPEIPQIPDAEKKDIIVTPVQPVQPPVPLSPPTPLPPEDKKEPAQPKAEERLLTPGDFLPTTPQKPETKDARQEPSAQVPPKTDATPEPQKDKLQQEKHPKGKPDPKPDAKPGAKPDAKKDKPTAEKKKGEALHIPPDAGKTGDMAFLEGCWQGKLSGRSGRDVIDNMGSRFCFDAHGKGKHFLYDPKRNETCVGSANGGVKADGTLRVDFDNLYCPSGETWYPQGDKYMTCRDGGNGADCNWYHKGKPRKTGPFYRD